jgi:hypothetical protein
MIAAWNAFRALDLLVAIALAFLSAAWDLVPRVHGSSRNNRHDNSAVDRSSDDFGPVVSAYPLHDSCAATVGGDDEPAEARTRRCGEEEAMPAALPLHILTTARERG